MGTLGLAGQARLTGKKILVLVVKEKGYVWVFLRLDTAKLRQAGFSHDLPEDVFQGGRFAGDDVLGQAGFVLCHGRVIEVEFGPARETGKVVHHKRARELAGTVAAVVVENDRIAVGDAGERLTRRIHDPSGGHKLIAFLRLAARVGAGLVWIKLLVLQVDALGPREPPPHAWACW